MSNNTYATTTANCSQFLGYAIDADINLSNDNSCGAIATLVADPLLGTIAGNGGPPQRTRCALAVRPSTSFLQVAMDARDKLFKGQLKPACSSLKNYIEDVRNQRGKKLSPPDADKLIALATELRLLLGC